ncbi:MAG TPA: hypothetical protein VN203_28980 [Candidatus Acidoferrum sp.]|nr:hypothetical protein [Candidatus Acidoferrum sp.]
MTENRRGGGVAFLALLISLIALGISILAYREAGGSLALKEQVQALQGAVQTARKETADALARVEQAVRPPGNPSKATTSTTR